MNAPATPALHGAQGNAMPPAPLRGKAALVTGSATGIGHEIALALASQGCAIALHGIEPAQQLQQQLEALQAQGVAALYHQVDLDDPAAIAAMVAVTGERFGSLDVLVNNAVTRHFAPLEAFPVAAWDKALAVNVSAAFHTVRLALPGMRERGWGRIVNMTSVYGERGTANRIDYVTSKAALAGMTRAIAAEVAGQGVTCNSVCPGSVLTPNIDGRVRQLMAERGLGREAAAREFLAGKQPGGRFVPAAHVAQLVLFLCGDAAAEINGALLPMDSGWLATGAP